MALSFAFDANKETPQSIALKREIMAQLLGEIGGGRAPQNWGEGIGSALSSIGRGIAGNVMRRRADAGERAGRAGADDLKSRLMAALSGQGNVSLDASGRMAAAFNENATPLDPASARVAQAHGDDGMTAYQNAIASIESAGSGDYGAIGPTHPKLGRALGRYQVMEANIGPWSKKHLGRSISADEFMQDPQLQDAIFNGEFGSYVDKYGPEGAAQAWFGGPGAVGKLGRKDSLGTSIGDYTDKFRGALGGMPPAVAANEALAMGQPIQTPMNGPIPQMRPPALPMNGPIPQMRPPMGGQLPMNAPIPQGRPGNGMPMEGPIPQMRPPMGGGQLPMNGPIPQMRPEMASPGMTPEMAYAPTQGMPQQQVAPPQSLGRNNPGNVGMMGPDGNLVVAGGDFPPPPPPPAAQGAPQAMQQPQAMPQAQQRSGPDLALLMEVVSNPFVDQGTKAFAMAQLQQHMQAQDPAHQLDMDYKRAQIEKMQRDAANPGGDTRYGLNPIYGQDADGNTVLGVLGNDGSFKPVDTGGVNLSTGVDRVDLGTHYGLLDKRSGQVVGTLPKENYQEAFDTGAGAAAGKAQGEAAANLPTDLATAEQAVKDLDGLINHPGLSAIAGPMDQFRPSWTMGAEGRDALARFNQAKGRAFLQAFGMLKGGGPITEIEGLKAEQAMARMDRAQGEADFKQALKDFRDAVATGMEKMRQRAGQTAAPAPTGGDGWQDVGGVKIRRKQ